MPAKLTTNEREIVDKFRQAAMEHPAVQWFDVGNQDFLFDSQRDLEFPCVFLQSNGVTNGDLRITNNFTLYCLDLPLMEHEADNTEFEFQAQYVDSRDTCLSIINYILGQVRGENRQLFSLRRVGPAIPDQGQLDGATGYRINVEIEYDSILNTGFEFAPVPMVTINAHDSTSVVNEGDITLTAATVNFIGDVTFAWSSPDGGAINATTGLVDDGTVGTFTYVVTATSDEGETATATTTIEFAAMGMVTDPEVTIGNHASAADEDSGDIQLVATFDGFTGVPTLVWSSPDGGTIGSTTGLVDDATPGTFTYFVNATFGTEQASDSTQITWNNVADNPTVAINTHVATKESTTGDITLTATTANFVGTPVLVWSSPDGGTIDANTGVVSDDSVGAFTYRVTASIGLETATDDTTITWQPFVGNFTVLTLDTFSVTGTGGVIDITVGGDVGTQLTLSLIDVDPSGWITDSVIVTATGTIPADGSFESTMSVPSTLDTETRTFRVRATNNLDNTRFVNSLLVTQSHVQTTPAGDLTADFNVETVGDLATFSSNVNTGDAPFTLELFGVDPELPDQQYTLAIDTLLASGGLIVTDSEAPALAGYSITINNVQYTVSNVGAAGGVLFGVQLEGSPDLTGELGVGDLLTFSVEPIQTETATAVGEVVFTAVDISDQTVVTTYYLRVTDTDGDVLNLNVDVDPPVVTGTYDFTNVYNINGSVGGNTILSYGIPLSIITNPTSEYTGSVTKVSDGSVVNGSDDDVNFNNSAIPNLVWQGFIGDALNEDLLLTIQNSNGVTVFTDTFTASSSDETSISDIEVGLVSPNNTGSGWSFTLNLNGNRSAYTNGIDYVTGFSGVPVGSNRVTQSGTLSVNHFTGGGQGGDWSTPGNYSMRAWVSDGTDFVYGPIAQFTIT